MSVERSEVPTLLNKVNRDDKANMATRGAIKPYTTTVLCFVDIA